MILITLGLYFSNLRTQFNEFHTEADLPDLNPLKQKINISQRGFCNSPNGALDIPIGKRAHSQNAPKKAVSFR